MSKSETTLGSRKAAALICRERGWVRGTRLVGDEGYGPTIIEITAVGDRCILAKTISHSGEVPHYAGFETSWALDCRDWKEVENHG